MWYGCVENKNETRVVYVSEQQRRARGEFVVVEWVTTVKVDMGMHVYEYTYTYMYCIHTLHYYVQCIYIYP